MKKYIQELDNIFKSTKPKMKKAACLYSGGLDSATAHYYWGGDKFTVIWEGFNTKDDSNNNAKILIKKEDVEKYLIDAILCFDRPVVETGIFPLYIAYKKLKELGYTHIITGDGGDELFMGYKWDILAWFKKDIPIDELINHLYAKHVYIAKSISNKIDIEIVSPFLTLPAIKLSQKIPLKFKRTLFNDKIIIRELMKNKIEIRPKYYFHNPIQEWLGINKKDKKQWFLNKWLEMQMTLDSINK